MNNVLAYKNRFEGAGILVFLASVIVFYFRIGYSGIGYLLTCFMMYEVMWAVFGENLSDHIGRSLRSKLQIKKYRSARIIWNYSRYLSWFTAIGVLIILGFAGSALVKNVFSISHAFYLVWIFAIWFVLRMFSETVSGYLCGSRDTMMIAGVSYLVRNIGLMIFGNICISLIADYGNKAALLFKQEDFASLYSCFAIGFALIVSEIVTLIFLLVMKLLSRQHSAEFDDPFTRKRDNTGNVIVMLWQKRIFEVITTLFTLFPFVFGICFLFAKCAEKYDAIHKLGLMGTLVFLPSVISTVFGLTMLMPLTMDITGSIRENKMRAARNMFQTGFHLCFIYGSFGCLYLMGESEILSRIFGIMDTGLVLALIRFGAFISLTMLASLFIMRLLVLNGLRLFVFLVQIPADIFFVVIINLILPRCSDITTAFSIALLIQFILKFIGYTTVVLIKLDMTVDPINNAIVPILVGAVVCVLNVFISRFISPHLGNPFTLLLSLIEMVIFYLIVLLLIRNFKDSEIKYLPAGGIVTTLGQTLHVL